jgi:iron complex transport system ATP-binding protein
VRGAGVLVVLHDLSLAARAHRAVVLGPDGSVVAAGPAPDVLTEAVLAAVFGVPFERLASSAGPVLLPLAPGGARTDRTMTP